MRKIVLLLALALAAGSLTAQPSAEQTQELHAAASAGDLAKVKALLDGGLDVNAKSEYGATALSFASDKGRTEVVKLLLERGADPNVVDTFYESSPLAWAAYNGHVEVVKLLIGAGVDALPAVGMAIQRDKLEVLRVVLASGKVAPESLSGAYAAAKASGKTEALTVLDAAGVKPPPPADAKIDPAILATYVGRYEGEQIAVTISLAGDVLQAAFGPQPPGALGAVDATHFRLLAFEGLSFEFKSENGQVTTLDLDQMGSKMTLKKVPDPAANPAPPAPN